MSKPLAALVGAVAGALLMLGAVYGGAALAHHDARTVNGVSAHANVNGV